MFIYTKFQEHGLLRIEYPESVISELINIVHSKVDEIYERYRPSQPQQPSNNDQFHQSEGHGYSSGTTMHVAPPAHTGNSSIFPEGVDPLPLYSHINHSMSHPPSHGFQNPSTPTINPSSSFTTNYSGTLESSATQSVPFQQATFNGADHSNITDVNGSFTTGSLPDVMGNAFYGNGQTSMNVEQGMSP